MAQDHNNPLDELDEADVARISEVFFEETIPKLQRLHARIGVLNCDFAGEKYKNWNLHFRSVGDSFEIVEFEYDEEGSGLDLDL